MRDKEAFMRAILEAPDDDLPRLVFSDWLEEHGTAEDKPQAELIRVQCELEHLPEGTPQRRTLEKQAKNIIKANSPRWVAPLRQAKLWAKWKYRRGFIHGVQMKATRFVQVAQKLFDLVPTLRALECREASNEVRDLANCPYLLRLNELDLHEMCVCGFCPIYQELAELFRSPQVANLTWLRVSDNRIAKTGAQQIASSPYLGNLRTLDLTRNKIGTEGVSLLLNSRALPQLKTLLLRANDLGPGFGRTLSRLTIPQPLHTLDLADNRLGNAGAKALLKSMNLAEHQSLILTGNGIGPQQAQALRDHFGDRVQV